jgi:hypothetical protein
VSKVLKVEGSARVSKQRQVGYDRERGDSFTVLERWVPDSLLVAGSGGRERWNQGGCKTVKKGLQRVWFTLPTRVVVAFVVKATGSSHRWKRIESA